MASAGGTTGIVSPPVGKGNSDTLGFAYTVATVYKTTGYKMNLDIRDISHKELIQYMHLFKKEKLLIR